MTAERNPRPHQVLLPESALPPRLIVCERSGEWAVALRATMASEQPAVRVYETRSLGECWKQLARRPSSFAVVELTTGTVDGLVDRLAMLHRQFPLAAVAVVGDRSMADYEWLLREAGAVYFAVSLRAAGVAARLAHRHLACAATPRRSVREKILAGLPWAPADDHKE